MTCGLDFGTSNCSIGVWDESRPRLLPLSGADPYMPSRVYVERSQHRAAATFRAEDERSMAYSRQALIAALRTDRNVRFGEDAVRANIEAPLEGFYFVSPKLFLGSELEESHFEVFTAVITAMLAEVRSRAQAQLGHPLQQVAIGHPVYYSQGTGAKGTRRAVQIMEGCAKAAGFRDIAFLPEPLAAAFGYELGIEKEQVILVVDVGGGTTDCAVVRVRPGASTDRDRSRDVLAWAGDRVGGGRMDFHVAWQTLMPHFGKDVALKDGRPLPHSILIDAISTENVPAQQRFAAAGADIRNLMRNCEEPQKLQRLLTLWEQGLQFRLMGSAEFAKKALSDKSRITLALHYVDPGLEVDIDRQQLREAIEADAHRVGTLASEALKAGGVPVENIFVTGGASRSPVVLESLRSALNDAAPIVRGDDFGSVTDGLTRYAKDVFSPA